MGKEWAKNIVLSARLVRSLPSSSGPSYLPGRQGMSTTVAQAFNQPGLQSKLLTSQGYETLSQTKQGQLTKNAKDGDVMLHRDNT